MTGIDPAASVQHEIGIAVARTALDQLKAEGDAVTSMIDAAKNVQEQHVKDGRLDVYA